MTFGHGNESLPGRGAKLGHGCLSGRRALITGSTRGIGLGLAERFLREGARVVINSEADDAHAAAARARLAPCGPSFRYIPADVSMAREAGRLVEASASCLGGLDLLVNCAAFVEIRTLPASDEEFIGRVVGTNLGSSSGLEGHAELTVYSASKGGLHAFTRALARELKGSGIRCNAVVPGWIENAVPRDEADPSWPGWLEYLGHCPLGRAGTIAEVAAVVTWLASSEAAYVNGQLIVVDGGTY